MPVVVRVPWPPHVKRRRRRGETDEEHTAWLDAAHNEWAREWRAAAYTNGRARHVSEVARFFEGLLEWNRYWLGQPELEAPVLCLECTLDLMRSASQQTSTAKGVPLTVETRRAVSTVWAVRKLTRAADREKRRRKEPRESHS